jgi:hypothetical protein
LRFLKTIIFLYLCFTVGCDWRGSIFSKTQPRQLTTKPVFSGIINVPLSISQKSLLLENDLYSSSGELFKYYLRTEKDILELRQKDIITIKSINTHIIYASAIVVRVKGVIALYESGETIPFTYSWGHEYPDKSLELKRAPWETSNVPLKRKISVPKN